MGLEGTVTLAIDFDHTICDTAHPVPGRRMGGPMLGSKEALEKLKREGHYILIHSCNRPKIIREWLEWYKIPFDAIWGENPADCGHKPVASYYVDDRAIRFVTWQQTLDDLRTLANKTR